MEGSFAVSITRPSYIRSSLARALCSQRVIKCLPLSLKLESMHYQRIFQGLFEFLVEGNFELSILRDQNPYFMFILNRLGKVLFEGLKSLLSHFRSKGIEANNFRIYSI